MSDLKETLFLASPHAIRTAAFNVYALYLRWLREGRELAQCIDVLDRLDRAGRAEVEAYQLARINELLEWAAKRVPYYADAYGKGREIPRRIESLSDLATLPLTSKPEVRAAGEAMLARSIRLFPGRTSGSTGSPLQLRYDLRQRVWSRATEKLLRLRAGMGLRDRVAVIWGRRLAPRTRTRPPFWMVNLPDRELWLSAFHLSPSTARHYLERISQFGAVALETYPTVAYVLALQARRLNFPLRLRTVMTTTETLFQFQREVIEETFQAEVYDYYGCAERVVFAMECGRHDGLHLVEGFGYVEPTPARDGDVPAGIVATGLTNLGMPLFRYRVPDDTHVIEEPCPCGLTSRRLAPVRSKCEDMLVTPDGRFVSPAILTHPFKPLRGVLRSQIIQETLSSVIVRLEATEEFDAVQERSLLEALRERMGDSVTITLRREERIEHEASGKFRWVICKVRGDHQVGEIGLR
jgi:phenylacetate-CoA ligase